MKNYDMENKIDELLSLMTLREKIGQLNQVMPPPEKDDEDFLQAIKNGEIGSIILASSSIAENGEKRRKPEKISGFSVGIFFVKPCWSELTK